MRKTLDFTGFFVINDEKIVRREVAGSNPVAPIFKGFRVADCIYNQTYNQTYNQLLIVREEVASCICDKLIIAHLAYINISHFLLY